MSDTDSSDGGDKCSEPVTRPPFMGRAPTVQDNDSDSDVDDDGDYSSDDESRPRPIPPHPVYEKTPEQARAGPGGRPPRAAGRPSVPAAWPRRCRARPLRPPTCALTMSCRWRESAR
jgi:hypothetical protein